jgi:hypothetical protein
MVEAAYITFITGSIHRRRTRHTAFRSLLGIAASHSHPKAARQLLIHAR